MQTLFHDLRYGARMLFKQPGFTLITVLMLGLGIGANTAIFSTVNAVLLRPLPYPEPECLFKINRVDTKAPRLGAATSPLNFLDWRSRNRTFAFLAGYNTSNSSFNLSGGFSGSGPAEPERINGARVSDTLFVALGVQPLLGRNFQPEEDRKGGPQAVIISHPLWARRFGANPNVLGQTQLLDGQPYTIVGVMPQGFAFPSAETALWVPFGAGYENGGRGNFFVEVIGRLKPGVTRQQAQADMQAVAAGLEREYPAENADSSVMITPLREQVTGKARPMLLILFGAVGFVLLITCANVAGLQLARASARKKEIAVRRALGAGGFRIVRQLLSESVLLAGLGGAVGLLFAQWGARALVALRPDDLPRTGEIGFDLRVLGFALAVTVLTGLLFGLAPALSAARLNLNEALKEGGRSGGSEGAGLRHVLVVAEIALALVLLIGAGLLMRSFARLLDVNPGFQTKNILTFDVALPWPAYSGAQAEQFFQQALDRLAALPGAQSVGATTALPMSGTNNSRYFTIEGRAENTPHDYTIANHRQISPRYLETLGVPLVSGRALTAADFDGTTPVAVINQAFAHAFFPGQNPLGKRIKMGETAESPSPWMTIVGVVGDVRHISLEADGKPELYRPFTHNRDTERRMTFAVRTTQPPETLTAAARAQIRALDRDQPIANVRTLEQLLDRSFARRRFSLLLLGIFAATALALAGLGIYGLLSYTVAQNTREIGIRMALGARGPDVLKLVVGQGMALTGVGVLIGVVASFALTRVMTNLLFGVNATDPWTFGAIALLLSAIAFVACWIPARRATKIDPMIALQCE
jgi:putative ABC transport system permease protein